ncbi:MAG: C40 family peptidase [Lachnospiraceae bacterium]|nr:C40 family peptidase [Lachnospiraceae bacterium]
MKKKLFSLLLAGALVLGMLTSAFADEISDLESENEYTEQQLLDLKSSISDIENQKADLLGDIDEKEKELVLTLAAISTLTEQVDIKNQDLAQTTKDLKTAKEDESTQYEAMKKRIQYLYETGGDAGWAVILLEDLSITDFLNRAEYTQQMYDYDRRCLEEYASTVERVSTLKEQEETEKTDLERMLTNQEEQQTYLEEQLTLLRAESDDYEKQLAEATATADAYVTLINEQNSMIQELLAEQERQRAAQEEANRIAEEQAAAAEEAARAAEEAEAAAQAADEAARAQAEADAEAARAAAEAAAADAQYAAAEAERARQEEEALAAALQQDTGTEEVQQDNPVNTEEPQEVQTEAPYVPEQPQISIPSGYPNVDRAAAWIGVAEYSYGACSPGVFDCSGFVSYCVTGGYTRVGTAYSFMTGFPQVSDPIPGDIASNGGHCGIYIGNGMMIHCADYGIGVIVGPVADNMIFTRY